MAVLLRVGETAFTAARVYEATKVYAVLPKEKGVTGLNR